MVLCLCVLTPVQHFGPSRAVAYQATLSTGFSRQGYRSGLPFPTPTLAWKNIISPYCVSFSVVDSYREVLLHQKFLCYIFQYKLNFALRNYIILSYSINKNSWVQSTPWYWDFKKFSFSKCYLTHPKQKITFFFHLHGL